MIEKMRKYTFILHHSAYASFLKELQNLGMVHIIKSTNEKTEKLVTAKQDIEAYANDIRFLKKWVTDSSEKKQTTLLPSQLKKQIEQAHLDKDRLKHINAILAKDIKELEPWGDFSYDLVKQLEASGLQVDLFICSKNHFKEEWKSQYALTVINEVSNLVYFAVVHKIGEPVNIEADTFKIPPKTLSDLKKHELEIAQELSDIDEFYRTNALTAIDLFEKEIERLSRDYDFEDATLQATPEAENQVLILQGWIPKKHESDLVKFILSNDILYIDADPKPGDDVPIMLHNNAFSKLFEPIARMFMLPQYDDLDLTPFFAPFYLMFFGFCSGDMGYGVVLFLLGFLMKRKAKNPAVIPYFNLIQILGLGTVVMGFVMGSVFAFDLKTLPWLEPSILIKNTNQIFNFALLLGVIQILWGIIINSMKQMRQSGIKGGIATLGTFLFILSLSITGSTMMGANPGKILNYTKYVTYVSLFMIFFFNSPGKNIFINVASGLWLMYNLVTGFFGDLLSYIRLFALGVSGAILGIVVNSMAKQFSSIPVIGPVIFLFFMIAGHGLNIALSSLGAFVHPLRLTFVEFYKNAGFNGPGLEYKPFGKK
jgi:V/A-type H+-transporting ATPase subunit I